MNVIFSSKDPVEVENKFYDLENTYTLGDKLTRDFVHMVTEYAIVESDNNFIDVEYRLKIDGKLYSREEMKRINDLLKA